MLKKTLAILGSFLLLSACSNFENLEVPNSQAVVNNMSSCAEPLENSNAVTSSIPEYSIFPESPVDLNDLEEVTTAYLYPLVYNNHLWSYSWNSIQEIHADDYIMICSYHNLLNLPRDFEMVYLDNVRYASAEKVEVALQKYFDISSEYLRTSSLYNSNDNTYELIGGFGGGWGVSALSAKQEGEMIQIEVGISQQSADAITPIGELRIKWEQDNMLSYISYTYF